MFQNQTKSHIQFTWVKSCSTFLGFLHSPFFWPHLTSLVTTTLVGVYNCFLNWKHTNFERELGDGRVYIAIFFSLEGLRLSISCSRRAFSVSHLPQQHDRLLQPCDATPCIAAGGCCGLAARLCIGPCWASQGSCPPACLGVSEWQPCSQHIDRTPTSTPPCNSVLSSFPGSFKVIRRMHTHTQVQDDCLSLFFLRKPF